MEFTRFGREIIPKQDKRKADGLANGLDTIERRREVAKRCHLRAKLQDLLLAHHDLPCRGPLDPHG
ncbi:hypothetical protein CWS35_11785 [Bradyrhizobium sp. SK17]|nr:hypothetical protein CWS35_11785 [Bradyrhizobium sp. SK17]